MNTVGRLLISGFVGAAVAAGSVGTLAESDATTDNVYYVYAPVVEARPVVHHKLEKTPRRECRPRIIERRHYRHERLIPTLVGSLIGGAIGRQFGGGRGRDALTIAGALAGADIANERAAHRHDGRRIESRERCVTMQEVRETRVIEAWRVTYFYQGKEFTRTVHGRPGDRIRVRIRVEPLRDEAGAESLADATAYRFM